MKKRNQYVLLDTNALETEYYYCLSDKTVYEKKTWYGKHPTVSPLIRVLSCVVSYIAGLIIGVIICALYSYTSSSIIWLYAGLLIFLTCVIICANDYYRRQKQLDMTRSQKSLLSFFTLLPYIKIKYKTQKKGTIIGFLLCGVFIVLSGEYTAPSIFLFSLCATALYFSIFRVGTFHKKQVIKQIERMYEIEKRKREQEREANLDAQEKWDL